METVSVPAWAWAAAGILGIQGLKFVLDVVLITLKGHNDKAHGNGELQNRRCADSCRPLWEAHTATQVAAVKDAICERMDKRFDEFTSRLDEALKRIR